MRLLIVNYELNEASNVLAWQLSIVRELAKYFEHIIVLTESIGEFELPPNVMVYLIPKRPWGIPKLLGSLWLMNFTVAKLIRKHGIDACFIHMAMEWTYRLFPVLSLHKIPILLWYAHGTVSHRLRLAHVCATKIVTSTQEGFRLPSDKKIVIGQGINTDLFKISSFMPERNSILYVGRISPRKRIHLLLNVMNCLRRIMPEIPIRLRIIGPVLSVNDQAYLDEVRSEIERSELMSWVEILGDMPQKDILPYYRGAFLHLNLSMTGSMDKTVMEALACGCPVLTSNEAFRDVLKDFPEFLLDSADPDLISLKIIHLYKNRNHYSPENLRALVVGYHDMHVYSNKIYNLILKMTSKTIEAS